MSYEIFISDEDKAGRCRKCGKTKFWVTSKKTNSSYWKYYPGVQGCSKHAWERYDEEELKK